MINTVCHALRSTWAQQRESEVYVGNDANDDARDRDADNGGTTRRTPHGGRAPSGKARDGG